MKRSMVFSLVVGVLLTGNEPASAQTDEPARHDLLRRLEHQEQARRQRIEQLRLAGKQNLEENRFSAPTILYDILPTGEPLFFTTCNLTAAQNVGTQKLWTGGELQLNLEGSNLTIGLWDAGAVRATHQEFTGRVSQIDNVGFLYTSGSNHATHVSGTLLAAGISPQARGMAKEARLWAYDWNGDVPEMAQAAAAGLLISNHSYGYSAWGMPQWMFGFYDQYAANWDEITYTFPYYLPVKAAGNDGGSGYNSADGGYDLLLGASNAKNALVVGAVYGDNYTGPESVRIAPFSSWGPTDDGRIKPDLVAPGVNLYSAGAAADNAYAYGSGTSMATPVVTGSLALLQEYYRRLYGSYMQAATLRALVIHTAREAGSAPGPDYIHGWGLLNVEEAARVMQASSSQASIIAEHRLAQEEELVFQLRAAGNMPLKVTIAWNDPAAIPDNWGVEDVRTPLLVNDLDLRVEGEGHEYLPWVLDPANPAAPAQKGDNVRDNVEQVVIENPVPGAVYTVRIRHKGSLKDGEQLFAMIATGIMALAPYAGFAHPYLRLKETPALPALPGDCRAYSEVNIPILVKTAADPVLLQCTVRDISARYGVDYDLQGNTDWVLSPATDTMIYCRLRIYDDAAIEDIERLELVLTSASGNIEGVFTSLMVEIESNDTAPVASSSTELFYDGFENGNKGWIVISLRSSVNRWRTGNMHTLEGTRSAYVSNSNYSGAYHTGDDADVLLISPPIDASMLQDEQLWLSFLYMVGGNAQDFAEVGIVDANVTTYTPVKSNYHSVEAATMEKLQLPEHLKGGFFRIAFRWVNDAFDGTQPAMIIDEVSVTALREGVHIASEVSQMPEANRLYLGPYDEVYFYDSMPGGLICRIENLSEHDYGCTQVYIDATGNPAAYPFYTDSTTATIAKNVHIIPTENNGQGSYRMRMYYTAAEVEAWQSHTGKTFDELMLIKTASPLSEADASTAYEIAQNIERGRFGGNFWVEGTFTTGFSGFSGANPFAPLSTSDLHLEAKVQGTQVVLRWTIEGEESIEKIEVERMAHGDTAFTSLQSLSPDARFFIDQTAPAGKSIYRVKAVFASGRHAVGQPVEVYLAEALTAPFILTPNPIEKDARLIATGAGANIYNLQLRNLRGDVLWQATWNVEQVGSALPLPIFEKLPAGIYLIEIVSQVNGKRYYIKALKN